MPVKLPKSLKETSLADIPEGRTVYVVPWAMFVGFDDFLWLNSNHVFSYTPQGTMNMAVTKLNDSYIVDVSDCDFKWDGKSFVKDSSLPVAELRGAGYVDI